MKEASDRVKQVVGKSRPKSLVASIHMSTKATELLEAEGASHIPSPGTTLWNSSYLMMNAIMKIESAKKGLLKKITEELTNSVKVTDRDVAILKEMCLIFEPLSNATIRLEADSVPTSGLVLPAIIGVTKAVNKVRTEYCTSVKTGIAISMDRRFGYIKSDDHYIIATVLEPRFKLKWKTSPSEVMMAD